MSRPGWGMLAMERVERLAFWIITTYVSVILALIFVAQFFSTLAGDPDWLSKVPQP